MSQSLLARLQKSTDKQRAAHVLGSYTDLFSLLDTSKQNCTGHNCTVSSKDSRNFVEFGSNSDQFTVVEKYIITYLLYSCR